MPLSVFHVSLRYVPVTACSAIVGSFTSSADSSMPSFMNSVMSTLPKSALSIPSNLMYRFPLPSGFSSMARLMVDVKFVPSRDSTLSPALIPVTVAAGMLAILSLLAFTAFSTSTIEVVIFSAVFPSRICSPSKLISVPLDGIDGLFNISAALPAPAFQSGFMFFCAPSSMPLSFSLSASVIRRVSFPKTTWLSVALPSEGASLAAAVPKIGLFCM